VKSRATYISERIDAYSGGANFTVTLTIANSARLDQAPELQEEFRVNSITHKNYVITAMLGSENLLAMRYPPTTQFQDRCRFRYKGPRCKYAGAMSSCDYTRSGDNGCEAHNNVVNFGGFSGLRPLNI
jgi:phage-related protein